MNSLELVGSRGINEKSRGIMDKGEMRLENNQGAKVQKNRNSMV